MNAAITGSSPGAGSAVELGAQHRGQVCDVTQVESVRASVAAVVRRWERVDALLTNAGIGDQTEPTLEQTAEAFDRVLAVHLRGSFKQPGDKTC